MRDGGDVEDGIRFGQRVIAGVIAERAVVAGAWNFERINRRYARHLKVLAERPGGALRNAHGGAGVAALGGGGARSVAGRGDERPAAAGPDSAVRLFGAIGVAAAGGSAPGRQPVPRLRDARSTVPDP